MKINTPLRLNYLSTFNCAILLYFISDIPMVPFKSYSIDHILKLQQLQKSGSNNDAMISRRKFLMNNTGVKKS